MGMEITRAVATAGYQVIMACRDPQAAEPKRQLLMRETGNPRIETAPIDLASLASVAAFAEHLLKRGEPLALLMNNAGTMETERRITEDGLERTVSVNYVGPYLLTRKLLPLMGEGSRIVNMVSCTYAIGHLDFPDFFLRGKKGGFWRIPIYSNTKLALTLFTIDLEDGEVEEIKLSEKALDEALLLDEDYQNLCIAYIDAQKNFSVLDALQWAVQDKSKKLNNLLKPVTPTEFLGELVEGKVNSFFIKKAGFK
jgi:short-subunit dehydrogenase involved in D-alanine esterification of teichoic acids